MPITPNDQNNIDIYFLPGPFHADTLPEASQISDLSATVPHVEIKRAEVVVHVRSRRYKVIVKGRHA